MRPAAIEREDLTQETTDVLQAVRLEEMQQVLAVLPRQRIRILEIGGGDGFQASLLSAAGHDVESIDVDVDSARHHFDVKPYDGRTLPFAAREFDYVFSSNVLEHVRDLPQMNGEILRVLKPAGKAVHVLPSSTWRFWTNLTHYPYLVKFAFTGRHSAPTHTILPTAGEILKKHGLGRAIRRALFPRPHGEYPSSIVELYTFSRLRWIRVFRRDGFDVVETRRGRVFYTGYGLLHWLSIAVRRRLAGILGSSATIFVIQPR